MVKKQNTNPQIQNNVGQHSKMVYPTRIISDIELLRAISSMCQMHVVSADFEERNDIPRLKRFSLVDWDHEHSDPESRKVIVHCGNQ